MNSIRQKKIVFWGIGQISKSIMESNKDIKVDFFIDSFDYDRPFFGRKVVHPNSVMEWQHIFVVVATLAYDPIKKQLEERGLEEKKDFCSFKEYLGIENRGAMETLQYVENFLHINPEYIGASFLGGPFFTGRKSEMIQNFFCKFVKAHNTKKFIYMSHTVSIAEKIAEDKLGAPFITLPDILNWQGKKREAFDLESEEIAMKDIGLSDEETSFAVSLQEIYKVEDRNSSIRICILIMKFFQRLLDLLKPSRILIGSDLKPEYRILHYYAEKMHITNLFWEYGWIPGTFIFTADGTAGQSRIARNKVYYSTLENQYSIDDIKSLKNYINDKNIDTTDFMESSQDFDELKKLDMRKKTLFLIGQGIDTIFNSSTQFWKEHVSMDFSSMKDIVDEVNMLCRRNSWNLIFKPHPGLTTFSCSDDRYADDIILIRDISVDRLINLSDVAISIWSAVDCKVLMKGKPLVQIGNSILNNTGCTYLAQSKNCLESQIKKALVNGLTQEQEACYNQLLGKLLSNCSWDDLRERDLRYGLSPEVDFFIVADKQFL